EYIGVLQRSALQVDASLRGQLPGESAYNRVYRSPEQGLHNKFDIWLNKDKTIMTINLRGTTSDRDSWLENFYSAMIPATGSLKLSDKYTFNYKFATDPKAAVHVGWAIGIGSIAPDIVDKVQRYYADGVKQIIVEGHSQGGVLCFLLTSYLRYLVADGKLPADLIIKTYCSGAPKPGNLYYAYNFDYITRGGWAFNIVNAADWVPETPFSIQTLHDMNNINPFIHAMDMMQQQKLWVRMYIGHVYHRLNRSTAKAQRRFEKNLGRRMYTQVRKYMPEYEQPEYAHSANYMRAGTPIVLEPDANYYNKFPDTGSNVFRHHLFQPYYYLASKIYKK
ncbi:MAG: lipase family protein, partial [Flavipsychrobacter sp.]|nr:lipase family protein [Flavipsychrobacter sp.]